MRVQLKSSSLFAQCGAGTCNLVEDSGKCQSDKWQSFTIESPTNKTGAVCYGDIITLSQVVGDKAEITAAGNRNVWATAKGTNENAHLCILPLNGSLYVSPVLEMQEYDSTRTETLCQRDPNNIKCTAESISNFFDSDLRIYLYLVIVIMALSCLTSLVYKVL
jgi:hypothetical protein